MGMLVSKIKYKKQMINVINFHLVPFHYFGENWADKKFQNMKDYITNLLVQAVKKPTIAIGDFNYADLGKIYPKLFSQGKYQETFLEVTTPTKGQQDHILYSNHWQLSTYKIDSSVAADHYLCSAELELKD
jgi:endonuclease/exonuclease/phosphatase family metal-dependent hydrolase